MTCNIGRQSEWTLRKNKIQKKYSKKESSRQTGRQFRDSNNKKQRDGKRNGYFSDVEDDIFRPF